MRFVGFSVCWFARYGWRRAAGLPGGVVEGLRNSEIEEGAVALSKLVLFDPGARLRVLDGAFAGQTGSYHAMTEAERVVLLFDLIGSPVRVAVPIHAVEAACNYARRRRGLMTLAVWVVSPGLR